MQEAELHELRLKVIHVIADKLLEAVAEEFEPHLKFHGRPFDFMKTINYLFDGYEIAIYIEGGLPDPEDICDGNIRFVDSAVLPDGRLYRYSDSIGLDNPFDVFLAKGGDSDKLTELLQKAK